MNKTTQLNHKFVVTRTKGVYPNPQKRFDSMYIERGNKGKKVTILPGIVFTRAK